MVVGSMAATPSLPTVTSAISLGFVIGIAGEGRERNDGGFGAVFLGLFPGCRVVSFVVG